MYDGTLNILGLMSGTSLDGMDAALVQFSDESGLQWQLLEHFEFGYPDTLKTLVNNCFKDASLKSEVDDAFAAWTISCIEQIKERTAHEIDAVGSHGQTIFHNPNKKYTFQAGCLPDIAHATSIPCVTDFRVQDVLLGGQGAPLVPMGDHLLFGEYGAALNLGGFANVSIGNPLLKDGVLHAFDICPANYVLNTLAREMGKEYDEGGKIALVGSINQWVLKELNSLPFFSQKPPKSLGAEWAEAKVFEKIDYLLPSDALATYCEHMAVQISAVLIGKKVLVTGGGAWNDYLLKRIEEYGVELDRPEKEIVNFKEAIIFALLTYLRLTGKDNVLGATTGSGKNHSSGKVFWP
ncbi:MAG TPA: anhydro-N-acetylmuramic acid kinase [Cryomorphaceae bacterium]|nr:anhydro-N-acetylmuramic acid kinase [Cryomorphaceae bacterium]|tara:strand:- start:194 stop:1246 length:1053 start_codon:yes stop_codon:yes gene_type:complete